MPPVSAPNPTFTHDLPRGDRGSPRPTPRHAITRRASTDAVMQGRIVASTTARAGRVAEHIEDPITLSAMRNAFFLANCGHSFDRDTIPALLDVPAEQRNCPLCATPITEPPKRNYLAQSLLDIWQAPTGSAGPMPEWAKDAASLKRWLANSEERQRMGVAADLNARPGARTPTATMAAVRLIAAGFIVIAPAVSSGEARALYSKVACGVVAGCIVGAVPQLRLLKQSIIFSAVLLGCAQLYLSFANKPELLARVKDVQTVNSGAYLVQIVFNLRRGLHHLNDARAVGNNNRN